MPTVSAFRPSTHGLKFANYWPPGTPALVINTPIGNVTIGDAGNGLCGGFCFTALDLQQAGRRPPSDTAAPAGGSDLVNYLTWRLIASWNIPSGILTYFSWANTPDHDALLGAVPGVWRMTIQNEIPKVTRQIDSGQPCTLGLVTVHSTNPADLAHCHQVLAYGYQRIGSRIELAVYDPNTPNGDSVTISLDLSDALHPGVIDSTANISRSIRGFFAVPYTFHDPSPIAGPSWQSAEGAPTASAGSGEPGSGEVT